MGRSHSALSLETTELLKVFSFALYWMIPLSFQSSEGVSKWNPGCEEGMEAAAMIAMKFKGWGAAIVKIVKSNVESF